MLAERTGAKALWLPSKTWANRIETDLPVLIGADALKGPPREATPRGGDDLAALMSTSGSTGTPRYVIVSHANLLANTQAIAQSQGLTNSDRAMLILPLSYCFGASVLHSHLFVGADVVLDRRFMFPDKVLAAIDDHQCTSLAGVPTVFRILLRRASLDIALPSLRQFLQAGGPLDETSIAQMRKAYPHARFLVMYGQTEATARITTRIVESCDTPGNVGQALNNLELRLTDEKGDILPPGKLGEVWVRGPSICRGYWQEPDATAERLIDGWLRTGDLGRLAADGTLSIEGRLSQFIKVRGRRLSLAEVEHRAQAAEGAHEIAACATDHAEAGQALMLFVVIDPNADAKNASSAIRKLLPNAWTIAEIQIVESLPKTASGKLDRSALLDWLPAQE